jgi:RND superfamily putative drug exporter
VVKLRWLVVLGATGAIAAAVWLCSELVAATNADLARIAIAVLVVNLVLLMLFLRAVVAPVLLLGCSVLALAASLGRLTLVFQDRLGHAGVAFYVPFAASVLLLSLGSDYNIYGVGDVWTRAKHTPLGRAIAERVPETSGAITAAGVTLAASFAMLALVPLRQFRELAFVMEPGTPSTLGPSAAHPTSGADRRFAVQHSAARQADPAASR